MKIALLALFFLLFSIINAEDVYDTDGDRLSKAHKYNIAIGSGYGRSYFTLPGFWVWRCPLHVMASTITPQNSPFPVKFSNQNNYPFIATDTPLNISFPHQCDNWFVEKRIPSGWGLLAGDAEGGRPLKGDFYIKTYEEKIYKIIFCPERSPDTCGDLHVTVDHFVDVKFAESVIPVPVSF